MRAVGNSMLRIPGTWAEAPDYSWSIEKGWGGTRIVIIHIMSLPECTVCCLPLTARLRKGVECAFCPYQACAACVKRYLLGAHEDAHCMSCRRAWDREALIAATTKAFADGAYQKHREALLFDRERAKMPATQPIVQARRVLSELHRMNIDIYRHVTQTLGRLWMEWYDGAAPPEAAIYHDNLRRMDYIREHDRLPPDVMDEARAEPEAPTYVRGCPADGCQGFLNQNYECGTCGSHCCAQCHEPMHGDHVCRADDVATAKLLLAETKPCPTCAVPIFKVSGCDQMWCVGCHTTFSWNKGTAERAGVLHNPHYYEWLRRNGVEAAAHNIEGGDAYGGGAQEPRHVIPSAVRLSRWVSGFQEAPEVTRLYNIHRMTTHLCVVVIDHYREAAEAERDHKEMRIAFMMGEMNEDVFRRQVYLGDKTQSKKRAIRDRIMALVVTSADILNMAMTFDDPHIAAKAAVAELEAHRVKYNNALTGIARAYTCAAPYLTTPDWTL